MMNTIPVGTKLIASAVGSVTAVFGFFNFGMKSLAPPTPESSSYLTFAYLCCLILLLGISALLKSGSARVRKLVALCGYVAGVGFLALAVVYGEALSSHTYIFPPGSTLDNGGKRFLAPPLHEEGARRVGGRSIAEVVDGLGVTIVESNPVLWTQESFRRTARHMNLLYLFMATTLALSLYALSGYIATSPKKASPPKKKTDPP